MKKVLVKSLKYSSTLGELILRDVNVSLDDEDFKKFDAGLEIEELDYGLSGDTIEKAERELAVLFFKKNYWPTINGDYQLTSSEISGVQNILNINHTEFAKLLGIDKASLTNIYKRDAVSRPVCVLVLERLGMELMRPGFAKKMTDSSVVIKEADPITTKEIFDVIFAHAA